MRISISWNHHRQTVCFVPNAFSPDGDGINDQFIPIFKDGLPEQYSLVIYNRWGQEMFDSNSLPKDGMVKFSKKIAQGIFTFYLVK